MPFVIAASPDIVARVLARFHEAVEWSEEKHPRDATGRFTTFYRGTVAGSTKRIDEPFEEGKGKTFVARRLDSAKSYGDRVEVIRAKPEAKILQQEDAAFWKLLKRRRPANNHLASVPGGTIENVNKAIRAAIEAGYDAISFSSDSDIGTVILNEDMFTRGEALEEAAGGPSKWDEEKHPRAKDGRFGSKAGGEGDKKGTEKNNEFDFSSLDLPTYDQITKDSPGGLTLGSLEGKTKETLNKLAAYAKNNVKAKATAVAMVGKATFNALPVPAQWIMMAGGYAVRALGEFAALAGKTGFSLGKAGYGLWSKFEHATLNKPKEWTQRLAAQLANDRGGDKLEKSVANISGWIDFGMSWVVNIPLMHMGMHEIDHAHHLELGAATHFLIAKIGYFLPTASLAYCVAAASTQSPWKTVSAAWKVLRGKDVGAHKGDHHESEGDAKQDKLYGPELRAQLVTRLLDIEEDKRDWWTALFMVAFDMTHDPARAMTLADDHVNTEKPSITEPADLTAPIMEYSPLPGRATVPIKEEDRIDDHKGIKYEGPRGGQGWRDLHNGKIKYEAEGWEEEKHPRDEDGRFGHGTASVSITKPAWQLTRKQNGSMFAQHEGTVSVDHLTPLETKKNQELIAEYARLWEGGSEPPPINVAQLPDGTLEITEGHHRYFAAKKLKKKHIQALITPVDEHYIALTHRKAVEQAIQAGKDVPPQVLADYPDLAPIEEAETPSTGVPKPPEMKPPGGPPSPPKTPNPLPAPGKPPAGPPPIPATPGAPKPPPAPGTKPGASPDKTGKTPSELPAPGRDDNDVHQMITAGKHKSAWERSGNIPVHYGKSPINGKRVAVKYDKESDHYLVTDGKKIVSTIPRSNQSLLAKYLPDKVKDPAGGSAPTKDTTPTADPGKSAWDKQREILDSKRNEMTKRHQAEEKAALGDQKSMSQSDRDDAARELYDKHEPERKAFQAENDKHQSEGHTKGYFASTDKESARVGKDDRAADKFHIWASSLKGDTVPEGHKSETAMKKMFSAAPREARKTLTVRHKGTGATQSFKVIQVHGHLLMQHEGGKLEWTTMSALKEHLSKGKKDESAKTTTG